jgi:Zn-dependent M28 family amino/carboxypeptidase
MPRLIERIMIYAALLVFLGGFCLWAYKAMIDVRPSVQRPKLTKDEGPPMGNLEQRLKEHVVTLADDIGPRDVYIPENLKAASDYVQTFWKRNGYEVEVQSFMVQNVACENLVAEIQGRSKPDEIVVVGAHYDTVSWSPGANDNGSAVAVLLELSRLFKSESPEITIRFVAFTNEEPPFFKTSSMGSLVYAESCRSKKENIIGMICLETMGYYREERKTQKYPLPLSFFYPDTGNFLAVVGNLASKPLVQSFARRFMQESDFPVECAAITDLIPLSGIDWSDHWSFWQCGYQAIMLTDTAPFRYPYYHSSEDTSDKLDYPSLARVTYGVFRALRAMVLAADA